jgi:hypothetical protein
MKNKKSMNFCLSDKNYREGNAFRRKAHISWTVLINDAIEHFLAWHRGDAHLTNRDKLLAAIQKDRRYLALFTEMCMGALHRMAACSEKDLDELQQLCPGSDVRAFVKDILDGGKEGRRVAKKYAKKLMIRDQEEAAMKLIGGKD